MKLATIPVWLLLATAAVNADVAGAAAVPLTRAELLQALGAETEAVRDEALRTLENAPELPETEVRAAIAAAGQRARPNLLRLVAARKIEGLTPEVVAALADADPVVTDAAARALVGLGDPAVAKGIESLRDLKSPEIPAVRTHLLALNAQHKVETEVLGKWRRKGGTYEGRYKGLAALGWPVQPVLLAMLLDVPLSDRHLVLPPAQDATERAAAQLLALEDIEDSQRRGYRTFEPLPLKIEPDELFDLAAQAMKDVADVDLVGDILERVSDRLRMADERAGFRLRPWEKGFYREIYVVLHARGRTERLEELADTFAVEVEAARARASRTQGTERAEWLSFLIERLEEQAGAFHQMRKYDEAAAAFEQAIKIGKRLTGKEPGIAGYNRACALSRGDRVDEAIAQLVRTLDSAQSNGSDDLTREWVTEDGDLERLHDDPRFKALIVTRFGE